MKWNVPSPWGLPPSQAKRVQDVVAALVYLSPPRVKITPAKLNKLIYIAELKFIKEYGRRLCPARILHWKHGPFSFDVEEALDHLDGGVLEISRHETGSRGVIRGIEAAKDSTAVELESEIISFLKQFCRVWAKKDYKTKLIPFTSATLPFIETPFHQVIDLERYTDLPEEERAELDYVPSGKTAKAIEAALKLRNEELDSMLQLVDA